jgi:hypothetical protein
LNPTAEAPEKPKDEAWADEPSLVNHLTDVSLIASFDNK